MEYTESHDIFGQEFTKKVLLYKKKCLSIPNSNFFYTFFSTFFLFFLYFFFLVMSFIKGKWKRCFKEFLSWLSTTTTLATRHFNPTMALNLIMNFTHHGVIIYKKKASKLICISGWIVLYNSTSHSMLITPFFTHY